MTIDPFLTPLANMIVGTAVCYFAFQQWRIAHNKFRLDLFERRYRVYEACQQFLSTAKFLAKVEDKDIHSFNVGTKDAIFLFPPEIKKRIDEIRERTVKLDLGFGIGLENEKKWIVSQSAELPKLFSPYLGFTSER